MTKNQTAFLLVLIMGVITVALFFKNGKSTMQYNNSTFTVEDTSLINKILVTEKGKTVVLERNKVTGEWLANGHLARKDAIKRLLYIIKSIRINYPAAKQEIPHLISTLTQAAKVEIFKHDELIKAYFVGSSINISEGAYILLNDNENKKSETVPFIVNVPGFAGDLSHYFTANEQEWRSHNLFHYTADNLKKIEVKFANDPASAFELQVLDNTFQLKTATGSSLTFDTAKVKQYISYYFNVSYERIESLSAEKRNTIFATGILSSIKVTDKNGQVSTVETYRKPLNTTTETSSGPQKEDLDHLYAVINGNKSEFAVMPYYIFGKLLMPVSYFLSGNSENKRAVKK